MNYGCGAFDNYRNSERVTHIMSMSSFNLQGGDTFLVKVVGLLGKADTGCGFDGNLKDNIIAVADTTIDATGKFCLCCPTSWVLVPNIY